MIAALSAPDIANLVRMMRTRFDGTIGLVEGSLDIRVYERMVQPGLCALIPGYGKETTLEALRLLNERGEAGVFAVVDRNFEGLLGIGDAGANVISTDAHDLETQIIASDALAKVIAEYGSTAKTQGKDIRAIVLRAGEGLGALRLVSIRDGLNLTFEDLTFSHFIDRDRVEMDIPALATAVKNRSGRPDLRTEELVGRVQAVVGRHGLLDICCGPDLVAILGLGFRKAFGSSKGVDVTAGALARSLRLAYERGDFAGTTMRRALVDWEARNPEYRIVSARV